MTTLQGRVHFVGQTETFGTFQKRLLVIDKGSTYDNLIPIDAIKDRMPDLDKLGVGDSVTVAVIIGGRQSKGKYYPSIKLDNITAHEVKSVGPAPANVEDGDDLAF